MVDLPKLERKVSLGKLNLGELLDILETHCVRRWNFQGLNNEGEEAKKELLGRKVKSGTLEKFIIACRGIGRAKAQPLSRALRKGELPFNTALQLARGQADRLKGHIISSFRK